MQKQRRWAISDIYNVKSAGGKEKWAMPFFEFLGTYNKTRYRDEKTGYTVFTVTPIGENIPCNKYGDIECKGVIPFYPKNIPLTIKGALHDGEAPYITIQSCKTCGKDISTVIAFLSGDQFDGVGSKVAEGIAKCAGGDIFDFCVHNKEAAKEFAKIRGVTPQIATELTAKVRKYAEMQGLISYLSDVGGTCEDAEAIYKAYGASAVEQIKKNPYALFKADIPFHLRESLAKKYGIPTLSKKRVLALIHECFDSAENSGSTCLEIGDLIKKAKYIEKEAGAGRQTNKLYLLSVIVEEKRSFVCQYNGGEVRVYRKSTFEKESRAARNIVRLINGAVRFQTSNIKIEDIEDMCKIQYDEQQKTAFNLFESSGIKVLTGGPGTGKSTVIKGLLSYYKRINPTASIALCAPTGAASKRLREVTGEPALTIHNLLDVRPFGASLQHRDEYNQLPYDLIIADEFSMVDTELFMMLVSGIKTGALLLIVGDEDQLASVGAGNILHDITGIKGIDTCRLSKGFRQNGGTALFDNSLKIKKGEVDLIEDESFEVHRVKTVSELWDKAIDVMKTYYGPSTKAYSPVKKEKYLCGTLCLNNEMHSLFNPGPAEECIIYGKMVFAKGDPVIMGRNNYKLHYMNGDEGFVYNIRKTKSGGTVLELCIDNNLVPITGKDMADVNLAYAITVHKSQGSECDTAIVIIPEEPAGMLERSIVYVAGTRAKKKNIFIVQNEALEKAIKTDKKKERLTGLKEQTMALMGRKS